MLHRLKNLCCILTKFLIYHFSAVSTENPKSMKTDREESALSQNRSVPDDSELKEPRLISQSELSYLVRELELSIKLVRIASLWLPEWLLTVRETDRLFIWVFWINWFVCVLSWYMLSYRIFKPVIWFGRMGFGHKFFESKFQSSLIR